MLPAPDLSMAVSFTPQLRGHLFREARLAPIAKSELQHSDPYSLLPYLFSSALLQSEMTLNESP